MILYVCILAALWCKILQFGGSLLGSAARVFFGTHVRRNGCSASSMCAHVRAQFPILESYDGYFDCFASFVRIIRQYSFVVQDCAFSRQLHRISCARFFCAHVRVQYVRACVSARAPSARIC